MRSETKTSEPRASTGLLQATLSNLAANLVKARQISSLNAPESPLTQANLAKGAGISRATLAKIESGDGDSVSLRTLVSLAECLDISPAFLLLGEREWSRLAQLFSEVSPEHLLKVMDLKKAEEMIDLVRSGSAADQKRATEMGNEIVAALGIATPPLDDPGLSGTQEKNPHPTPQMMGASIGTLMTPQLPFIGAVIGAALGAPLGKLFSKKQPENK